LFGDLKLDRPAGFLLDYRGAVPYLATLADRPRVVSVIGEPGIRSVPICEQRRPVFTVGPHKSLDRTRGVVWDSRETDTSRPSIQVVAEIKTRQDYYQVDCKSNNEANFFYTLNISIGSA
jgi:hypothetical protein